MTLQSTSTVPSSLKLCAWEITPRKSRPMVRYYRCMSAGSSSRSIKKENSKNSLIFDEFPIIYLNNMDSLIATARSNKVCTCLGIQDFSQLRKDYGRKQADVILFA
nr:type IV secretory system conjugative DNA transfer family protein [uncultured Flavobacterium sp.]